MSASKPKARRHVQQGMEYFQQGEFQKASKSFAEADVALPENPRIAFNQACTLAAQGDVDKATELFQVAALTLDNQLAANAQYNLGCVLASQAKALFGEQPESASPEVRQQGLEQMMRAIRHYRDCLELDEQHENARHNLELLRLWIKHMQDVWAQRDRQQQREEMGLLEFLEMIQTQQEMLRTGVRLLARESDSPKRRQSLTQTESAQRQLAEEIDPLKEKIETALQPPAQSSGGSTPVSPNSPSANQPSPDQSDELESAVQALTGLADQIHESMLYSADSLASRALDDAIDQQREALDQLNELYMAVAPFNPLLAKATSQQQSLIDTTQQIIETLDADPTQTSDQGSQNPTDDFDELAWQQKRVSQWAQILQPKAEQELNGLESLPDQADSTSGSDPQQTPSAEQIEALRTALEKAVELGPEIHELTKDATDHLGDQQAKLALPKEEEAHKLLKEIAESLPQDPQNQDQQNEPQDDQQQDQNQENGQQSQQDQTDQQPPQRDLSRQQAESVLRKVRERERTHNELQKQLQQQIQGRAVLDRDW